MFESTLLLRLAPPGLAVHDSLKGEGLVVPCDGGFDYGERLTSFCKWAIGHHGG